MKLTLDSKSVLFAGASALAMTAFSPGAIAQEDDGAGEKKLGTVLVTTQKREESIQDVPIAVSAFDPENLDRLNINTGVDLQFSIPNFQATQGNFSAGSISIRGIAPAGVGASVDAAVGTHVNGVPSSGSKILETEFYDVERIEILRGPQGTLYGRNATAGVLNAVTAKPVFEEFSGNVELSYGEFNHQKATGHVNIPLGSNVAARIAGFYLSRDGYSDAKLFDGRTVDADGRDLYAIRGTLGAEITEKASFWTMFEYYEEDDTRSRAAKQLCTVDPRPFPFNQGCVPYEVDGLGYARDGNGNPVGIRPGFDTVNNAGTLGGVLAGNLGLYDSIGVNRNPGGSTARDLRESETNIFPQFQSDATTFQAEFQYEFDNDLTLTLLGAYQDQFREFTDDYNKGVGTVPFNITPLTPDVDGDGDGDFPGGEALGLELPIDTRMRVPADVLLATDNSGSDFETTSFEARLQSDFDGPWNFTLGALQLNSEGETTYYVFFNTAEALAAATGLPGDRSYFFSRSPYELDAFGAFGELYWEVNPDFKWTLGLRYTKDEKTQAVTPSLLLEPPGPAGAFDDPVGTLNGFFLDTSIEPDGIQEAEFEEITGRIGFDWQLGDFGPADDTLLYAFLSRGYKGGGINPPQSAGLEGVSDSFDPEFINSFEVGTKSSIMDGTGQLNLAAFYYDYEGYQISSIVNRTSVNQNIDAEVMGLEGEFYWQVNNNLRIDTTFGLLDSELADQDPLLDTYDQTGGNPDWYVAKDPVTTQNCIVDAATTDALVATVTGTPLAGVLALACDPATLNATLAGALGQPTADALTPTVQEGIPVDVSGNELPRAPNTTFSIGAQYEWAAFGDWDAVLRGDYYYQDDMFSRIFNLEADRIDSWNNANASLTFRNDAAGWEFEIYGKNLLEDDQITNQYLTDASSGLFTNIFLLEPRQFGVRVGKSW